MSNYNTPGFWSGVGNKFGEAGKWMQETANDGYNMATQGLDYAGQRIGDVAKGDFSGELREQHQKDQFGKSQFANTSFQDNDFKTGNFGSAPVSQFNTGGPVVQAEMDTSNVGWDKAKQIDDMNAAMGSTDDGSGINWALAFKDTADALSKLDQGSQPTRFAPVFKPSFSPTKIDDSIQKAQLANTNQMDINAILGSLGGGVRGR